MKSSKKFDPSVFFLPAVFFCLIFLQTVAGAAQNRQEATVKEVLTGDTVRLAGGGKTVRYIGVSAPPLQSTIPLLREYGEKSLAFNKALVEGKKIYLEWDSRLRDNRNNLLAYVFLEDGTFVNREILKSGNGKLTSMAPNLKHVEIFRKDEMGARRERKGVWDKEPKDPYLQAEYIGDKNTKLFYFPNSPELERIPEAHWVKFRSRVEAKAAGFRACATCKNASDPYANEGY